MNKNLIIDLSNETELSKILYRIGYYFYKCRGIHFDFVLKNNAVYAINENEEKEEMFILKDNKIFRIHNYLKTLFRFPTTEIKIEGWGKYIIEG